ncbi:MAG TPA: hypothetical protein VKV73_24565 [Chloroflexota bacterium]|nr:hypothetical protein [Chloroflexota bacterium]
MVGTFAGAQLAWLETGGVRWSIVEMRGAYLIVPADGVHTQRQRPRMLDQFQERCLLAQRIP